MTEELFSIEDRVVVVTGASSGIGEEVARGLAAAGARVVVSARRQQRLEEVAGELAAAGADVLPVVCDVCRETDVEALVAATRAHFGGIDALVNNAGITEVQPAEEEPLETFERVVSVNLTGAFLCAQRFGREMLESGRGSIVNVASVLGLVGAGQIPQASYAASKGALVNLTRELAAQWARRGVRVNAVAPAWFESEMTAAMFSDARSLRWIERRTPMGRAGALRELVGPVRFLLSDAASYVTGQVLAVDGGWTII